MFADVRRPQSLVSGIHVRRDLEQEIRTSFRLTKSADHSSHDQKHVEKIKHIRKENKENKSDKGKKKQDQKTKNKNKTIDKGFQISPSKIVLDSGES